MFKHVAFLFLASALIPGNPLFGLRDGGLYESPYVVESFMSMETCRNAPTPCLVAAAAVDGARIQAAFLARSAYGLLTFEGNGRLLAMAETSSH